MYVHHCSRHTPTELIECKEIWVINFRIDVSLYDGPIAFKMDGAFDAGLSLSFHHTENLINYPWLSSGSHLNNPSHFDILWYRSAYPRICERLPFFRSRNEASDNKHFVLIADSPISTLVHNCLKNQMTLCGPTHPLIPDTTPPSAPRLPQLSPSGQCTHRIRSMRLQGRRLS